MSIAKRKGRARDFSFEGGRELFSYFDVNPPTNVPKRTLPLRFNLDLSVLQTWIHQNLS